MNAGVCEWVRFKVRSNCAVCGRFAGWIEHQNRAQEDQEWRKFRREQQAKHNTLWQKQIDNMALVPKSP